MVDQIIGFLTHFIIQTISTTGYGGIFILMALESALIPIPSEVTMPFSGYLATTGRFDIWTVILVGTLANVFGSLVVYYIGHWGEERFARGLIKNYGKYVLISYHEFERSEKWFRDHGEKIVFFSRVLPIVRTFISLPAGIAHMNVYRFTVLTFIGSLIWSIFLTYVGVVFGENWHSIEVYYRKFEYGIVAIFIFLVVYYIWHKVKQMKK